MPIPLSRYWLRRLFPNTYIANPDLVERLSRNAPLNALDAATLYGGDARDHTDYPFLDAAA